MSKSTKITILQIILILFVNIFLVDGFIAAYNYYEITNRASKLARFYYIFTVGNKFFLLPILYSYMYKKSPDNIVKRFLHSLRTSRKTKTIVLLGTILYVPFLVEMFFFALIFVGCLTDSRTGGLGSIFYLLFNEYLFVYCCICMLEYFIKHIGLFYAYIIMYIYWFIQDKFKNKFVVKF